MKSNSDLPPGVTPSMIPGNTPEEEDREKTIEIFIKSVRIELTTLLPFLTEPYRANIQRLLDRAKELDE